MDVKRWSNASECNWRLELGQSKRCGRGHVLWHLLACSHHFLFLPLLSPPFFLIFKILKLKFHSLIQFKLQFTVHWLFIGAERDNPGFWILMDRECKFVMNFFVNYYFRGKNEDFYELIFIYLWSTVFQLFNVEVDPTFAFHYLLNMFWRIKNVNNHNIFTDMIAKIISNILK